MKPLNPYYRDPDNPNFNRRAFHHDYHRPARYLLTMVKSDDLPNFSSIPSEKSSLARPIIIYSKLGLIVRKEIKTWIAAHPQIEVPAVAIMPDHIHLCVAVKEYLKTGLSLLISNLKGNISKAYHNSLVREQRPDNMKTIFRKGFNDRIAYDYDQWESQKRYTLDNPRRYIMKHLYPDYLRKRWLLTIGDKNYVMLGNIFLLRMPTLFQVKFSRKFTQEEAEKALEAWKINLRNGGVPISPYIHSKEKALRDTAIEEGYSYIRVCSNGFSERESASGREFELMSQGRLLLIGQEKFMTREPDMNRSRAKELNNLSAELVKIFNGDFKGGIRPLLWPD